MEKRTKILGIAPYEGMKAQMMALAAEYPQIDLTAHVGDLEQGLAIAQNNFHANYDVVISRGATAQMLRQHLTLPVVEIDISIYDILCALKLAGGLQGKTAMIFFAKIQTQVQLICNLMEWDIDIYAIDTVEQVEPTLQKVNKQAYQAILCDVIVNTAAQRLGMKSYLITSGMDSIRSAFDHALQLCGSLQHLREENLFFQELIRGQIGQTVVFDSGGQLALSTVEDPSPELLEVLRQELSQPGAEEARRISRSIKGMLYSIRIRKIFKGNACYTVFFFDARKTPVPANRIGIRFYSKYEAEAVYYNSIFSFAGSLQDSQREITQINQSTAPVILTGEDGTGKESAAHMLYIKGALQNSALISINCSQLTDKGWDFLMEHYSSPLADEGNTLYFANVDVLPRERQYQLIVVLGEMDVCRRNRVIFSCVCQSNEYVSKAGALLQDKLGCLSLYLPPLRQIAQRIPALVNLCISHMNITTPQQILGAEPQALALLQKYQWPHNYTQFRRVIEELAITQAGQMITADNVRRVLQKERHVGTFSPQQENAAAPLDLNRPLTEISRDVAMRVIEEASGNHTVAAKRLGISRTTLWRMMQK